MLWKMIVLCMLTFLPGTPCQAGSGLDFNPGLWEVTSQIAMPGMRLPPTTSRQCLQEDDPVPSQGSGEQCTVSDVSVSKNTVSWTVVCSEETGQTTGRGKVTYRGDSFEGRVELESQGMDMTMTLHGKRLSKCQ